MEWSAKDHQEIFDTHTDNWYVFSIHELAISWLTFDASNSIYRRNDMLWCWLWWCRCYCWNRTCNSKRYDDRLNSSKRYEWTGMHAIHTRINKRKLKSTKLSFGSRAISAFKDSAQSSCNAFHHSTLTRQQQQQQPQRTYIVVCLCILDDRVTTTAQETEIVRE